MKDILFIGGPTEVHGADRIDDDLTSILAVEGLNEREAVVLWPTKDFMSEPQNPDELRPYVTKFRLNVPPLRKLHIKFKTYLSDIFHIKRAPDIRLAQENYDSTAHIAVAHVIQQLSELFLVSTGGMKLIVVLDHNTPKKAMRWNHLIESWGSSNGGLVKQYESKSPCCNCLNSITKWTTEFKVTKKKITTAEDLLPIGDITVKGIKAELGSSIYSDYNQALKRKVCVTYPVENRFGNALAVQVVSDNGYMLVIPPPTNIDEFIKGIQTSLDPAEPAAPYKEDSASAESSDAPEQTPAPSKSPHRTEQEVTVEEYPSSPSIPDDEVVVSQSFPMTDDEIRKAVFMTAFIQMAEQNLQFKDPVKWKQLVDETVRKLLKEGLVTNELSLYRKIAKDEETKGDDYQTFRRYMKPDLETWYDQQMDFEKRKGLRPTSLHLDF